MRKYRFTLIGQELGENDLPSAVSARRSIELVRLDDVHELTLAWEAREKLVPAINRVAEMLEERLEGRGPR